MSVRQSPLPDTDMVTVMEKDGEMKQISCNSPIPLLQNYPEVSFKPDVTLVSSHREASKTAFMPTDRSLWQQVLHAWHEQGFTGFIEEIVNRKDKVSPSVSYLATYMLSFLRTVNSLNSSMFPHLSLSSEDLLVKFAEVANWSESPVRAFAWHPHITKFALALQDDAINVYTANNTLVPVLKHKLQKNVSHLAWQPLSASVLAVACQSCVLIWHVEPNSLAARPSASSVQVLQQLGHLPVTRLAWDPTGKVLLSAAPTDTAIMAWSVPTELCTPMRRFDGGGISFLAWSPDGSKVLSATPSKIFRVWETNNWNCEVWSHLSGQCTAACWSWDGHILLFTMESDTVLHSVRFRPSFQHWLHSESSVTADKENSSSSAVPVADLSEMLPSTETEDISSTGVYVQQMVWNRTSERLAVLFQGQNGTVPYIAIFKTILHPMVQVLPSGVVKGFIGEIPCHIAFQPSFEMGALLSVVWSSGRVGYIPMYFVAEEQIGSFQFQQSVVNGLGSRQLYTD